MKKPPTSLELLQAAQMGQACDFPAPLILTAEVSNVGIGKGREVHIHITDRCPVVTYRDRQPLMAQHGFDVPSRDELGRSPLLRDFSRVSAGTILRLVDNDLSATIGLERGYARDGDASKADITNPGRITYMNGGVMCSWKDALHLPSQQHLAELNQELVIHDHTGPVTQELVLQHRGVSAFDPVHRLGVNKGLQEIGRIQGPPTEAADVDITQRGMPGTITVRTFADRREVDITQAFPYYEGYLGSLELPHFYDLHLPGALRGSQSSYDLFSSEPLGGRVHVMPEPLLEYRRLTTHFAFALLGNHGDLARLPKKSCGVIGVGVHGPSHANPSHS